MATPTGTTITPGRWYKVKDFFGSIIPFVDEPEEQRRDVCLQCHGVLKTRQMQKDRLCSQKCAFKYWEQFQRTFSQDKQHDKYNKGIPLCPFPGCEKQCYVEKAGADVKVHDYCSKRHANAARQESTQSHPNFPGVGHRLSGQSGRTRGTQHRSTYSPRSQTESSPIYFYNKDEPFYEFTNFYKAPIKLDDKLWETTEHYFQAQKFIGTPYVEKIRNCFSAREAFEMSRQPAVSRWRRSDWDVVKLDVMKKALFAKFTQHAHLQERLLINTEGRKLVERSPFDSYWGDGADRTGKNHLGRLLEELRTKLTDQDANEKDGVPDNSRIDIASDFKSESKSEGPTDNEGMLLATDESALAQFTANPNHPTSEGLGRLPLDSVRSTPPCDKNTEQDESQTNHPPDTSDNDDDSKMETGNEPSDSDEEDMEVDPTVTKI